jgi:hypothetical protein
MKVQSALLTLVTAISTVSTALGAQPAVSGRAAAKAPIATRSMATPASRLVGHWRNDEVHWYFGTTNDELEGVIYVVDGEGGESRWKFRILSEAKSGERLEVMARLPSGTEIETKFEVARDGKTATMSRVISGGGFSVLDTSTLKYVDRKRRP